MSEERAGRTIGGRVPFSTTWRCKCGHGGFVHSAASMECLDCGMKRPPESYWPHEPLPGYPGNELGARSSKDERPISNREDAGSSPAGSGETLFRLNWDELRAVQKVRREAFQRLGTYRASELGWPQVTEAYERLIEIDTEIDRRKDEEDL